MDKYIECFVDFLPLKSSQNIEFSHNNPSFNTVDNAQLNDLPKETQNVFFRLHLSFYVSFKEYFSSLVDEFSEVGMQKKNYGWIKD